MTRKISIRQTKAGDWLICEAIPNALGIGVQSVGDTAPGYKTGHQYDRYPTEHEAIAFAEGLAAGLDAELVDWQHPEENSRFEDLPRLFPKRTSYQTVEEAEADGWIRINPSKTVSWYRGMKIYCKDISPGNSFGYDLAIVANGRQFTKSSEIGVGPKISVRFRAGEVVEAIETAKKYIDFDLITQAEAAKLMAGLTSNKPLVQTIHNSIVDGRLKGYSDPTAKYQRQGATLVSRDQIERIWSIKDE